MAAPYLVVFAPEAATEVTAIAAWWHKHRLAAPGLFQQELKQTLLNIATFPELGVRAKMPADPDVRAVVLRRTGYVVFYDVHHAASEIHIFASPSWQASSVEASVRENGTRRARGSCARSGPPVLAGAPARSCIRRCGSLDSDSRLAASSVHGTSWRAPGRCA